MYYLDEIAVDNFRCYDKYSVKLTPFINIIEGINAIGKTSLLEAVYFLGLCKSFRTNDDKDMLKEGKNEFYIKGTLIDEKNDFKIVASFSQVGKKISVNGKTYRTLSDYIGFLQVVCFSPDDLKLIKGEPRIKRKFLDVYIGQTDKLYLKTLVDYNKILRERNELLKNPDSYPQFNALITVYTNELAKLGAIIINKRRDFLNLLEPFVSKKLSLISSNKENVEIRYVPNVSETQIEQQMLDSIEIDKKAKTTTVGPHRDDIMFLLNGLNAGIYGSQGQKRSIALAVKLGLADYMKQETNKIIVILDDVFGELDQTRQNMLISAVDDSTQVIITTISTSEINKEIIEKSNLIKIEKKVTQNG